MSSTNKISKKSSDTCYKLPNNKCNISNLVNWADPQTSGIYFGAGTLTLLILQTYTFLGILSFALFYITLGCSIWVLIKNVVVAFNTNQGEKAKIQPHPFKPVLDLVSKKLRISENVVEKNAIMLAKMLNNLTTQFISLVFVESWSKSAIFAIFLYFVKGILMKFHLLELLLGIWIGLFSIPFIYTLKKKEIDQILNQIWQPIKPHFEKFSKIVGKYKSVNSNNVDQNSEKVE